MDTTDHAQGHGGHTPRRNPMASRQDKLYSKFCHAIADIDRALLNVMLQNCSKALEGYVDAQVITGSFEQFLSNPAARSVLLMARLVTGAVAEQIGLAAVNGNEAD